MTVAPNSPEFRSLQHLGSVNLLRVISDSENRVDLKRLPKKVGRLTIEHIAENSIGSPAPIDLAPVAQVTDLDFLDIHWPAIENLAAIATLRVLTELRIRSTEIRPVLPLPADRILVYKAVLSEIGDLTSLAPLGFIQGLNVLTLDGIGALYDLMGVDQWQYSLSYLNVVNSPVVDISALTELHWLTALSLSETYIDNVSALRNLRELTHLDLSHTSVTDIFPLAGLTNLQFLNLDGTRVSDISPLRKMTALKEMKFAGSQIHDLSPLAPGAEIMRGPTSDPVAVLNPFATY
jgi:internalin A